MELIETSDHIFDSSRVFISKNAALQAQAVQSVAHSIIIFLVPYWLYKLVSSLYILVSSLGAPLSPLPAHRFYTVM